MNENIVVINNKVKKIKYQTFVSKDWVRDKTPSVLLDVTLWLLERIESCFSNTITDGSATW